MLFVKKTRHCKTTTTILTVINETLTAPQIIKLDLCIADNYLFIQDC